MAFRLVAMDEMLEMAMHGGLKTRLDSTCLFFELYLPLFQANPFHSCGLNQ